MSFLELNVIPGFARINISVWLDELLKRENSYFSDLFIILAILNEDSSSTQQVYKKTAKDYERHSQINNENTKSLIPSEK